MNEVLNNTKKYDVSYAYKLEKANINAIGNKIILPQYLAYLLK